MNNDVVSIPPNYPTSTTTPPDPLTHTKQRKAKYSHGCKRNKEHLAGDKVMLPVTDSGEPDYRYMEQYAKNMMLRKYQQYLAFLNRSDND